MNAATLSSIDTPRRDAVIRRIALGLIAIGCYVLHAIVQTAAGTPENLLWACHAAALAVGVGLLLRIPMLVAIGTLLLTIGVPAWLINLAAGGAFYPTSILTHLGGWTCGVLGLRWGGCYPRHAACGTLIFFAGLMLAARLCTPAAANINLAHAPWKIAAHFIHTWPANLAFVLTVWAVLILAADYIVQRIVQRRNISANIHCLPPALAGGPIRACETDSRL